MISRTRSSKHCSLYTINNWCMNPMNNKPSLTCTPIWKIIVEFFCVKFVMELFAKIVCISNFIGLKLVCQFLPILQFHWPKIDLSILANCAIHWSKDQNFVTIDKQYFYLLFLSSLFKVPSYYQWINHTIAFNSSSISSLRQSVSRLLRR